MLRLLPAARRHLIELLEGRVEGHHPRRCPLCQQALAVFTTLPDPAPALPPTSPHA